MGKNILKAIKHCRSSNKRLIFVILGNKGFQKIPDLYKLVSRKKSLAVNWFSSDNSDIRKIDWTCNNNDDRYGENGEPKVSHVPFCDIQNTSLQTSYFVVVHDMDNIKPSDLVKIVESVSGKGLLIFTFSEIKDIDEIFSSRRCNLLKSRFMRRLITSFTKYHSCITILNDKLDVLAASKSEFKDVDMLNAEDIHDSFVILQDDHFEIVDKLIKICSTKNQCDFLSQCLETLKRRSIHCTISASSVRGRGKSIVLGLAIAGAIALKYSNIFISSLNYDNVKVVFKYLLIGLDAIDFKEDEDYDLIQSVNPEFNNALIGLNIFKDHPQAVRFIYPGDIENKLEQAELVVIDEAAAMPLPLLKKLFGPYIVLMTTTVNSYEGTGEYLYCDMITEIHHSSFLKTLSRDKTVSLGSLFPTSETISWKDIILEEPINYSSEDGVERWMNRILCFENPSPFAPNCPDPQSCRLFYVCRETLFSYDSHAEKLLHQLMRLFLFTKRTISPDILLKMADDNNYHIFCLLPPYDSYKEIEILGAILVHTEKIVPWNIIYSGVNQFADFKDCFNEWASIEEDSEDFLNMQGIHIIDIVTYPNFRKMGYGSRTLQLLQDFYEGKFISLDDKPYTYSIASRNFADSDSKSLPPLLIPLSEVEPEKIDYILVSYFLTPNLLRFWKRVEFIPVYISKEKNTSKEHLCFMMKGLSNEVSTYMTESWQSFRESYFVLLQSYFKDFSPELALNLLNCKFSKQLPKKELTKEEIDIYLKPQRMKALEKYCQNLGDLHCIMPCIPILAKLFFSQRFVGVDMPVAQQVILLAFGLQHKTIEDIAAALSLNNTSQIHGLLNRTVRKLTTHLTSIIEKAVEKTVAVRDVHMEPISQSLDDELEEAAQKIKKKQKEDLQKLKEMDFSEFAIKGSEDDWEKALHSGRKTLVSIKSLRKAPESVELPNQESNRSFKHKKKDNKRKR